jgi:hypothetical protein
MQRFRMLQCMVYIVNTVFKALRYFQILIDMSFTTFPSQYTTLHFLSNSIPLSSHHLAVSLTIGHSIFQSEF